MDITPRDKIKIFKEEVDAKKQVAEANEKRQIETLTQEEREQIFNELNEIPAVFIDEKDITKPYNAPKGIKIITGIIFIVTYFYVGFFQSIVVGVLGAIVNVLMRCSFYKLRYSCPTCRHQREGKLHSEKEQNDFQKLGYVHAKCMKCSQEFNLYCESLYGVTMWELKD